MSELAVFPGWSTFYCTRNKLLGLLSLSVFTHKMEGLLPLWDWVMGKNGTGGRWGNVKAVN